LGDSRFGFVVAFLALAAAAAAAGCAKGDPSGATSVYLTVENGPGLTVPDELRVTATGDSGPVFEMQRLPASGPLLPPAGGGALLGTVTLYVGAGVSQLAIDVRGYAGGAPVSEGTASVGVVAGKQVSATVMLAPSTGADGGAGEEAGGDAADAADAEEPVDGGAPADDGAPPSDGGSAEATDAFDAPAPADAGLCQGSTLSGTAAAPVSPVNLTTEGTTDWRHWGAMQFVDFKAISGSLISDYTVVGGGTKMDILSARGGVTFEWTDGAPPRTSTTQAPYSVGVLGNGAGFTFTVPATAAAQTLAVYLSGQNDVTTFTASLSDGCRSEYTVSRTDTQAYAAVHRITFKSAVPGAQLSIRWVMSTGSDPIGLFAATLY
jgi:hypothetical protein